MKKNGFRLASLLLIFCLVAGCFSFSSIRSSDRLSHSSATETVPEWTVVLDAGHGGEDGGAVSSSGVFEKDVNLSITLKLNELLCANGTSTVLTRSEDILLYDKTVDYHGRKKALDLAARRKIAEETPNCIFVSIHLNAFPQSQYSGLQVWYSQNTPASLTLAQTVQKMTAEQLQPQNDRRIKPATSSIYLLHHLQCPAILVECGFLSNPEEASLLSSEDYQNKLAFLLFLAISDGITKISPEFTANP
ncbi:MAG: N-acetylmuramoyl-L-alanine amidase [Clostridia bacterium]|nr:N-acetylmuramoyl-L-alanine amidase [Clostridia bacterium]